MGIDKFGRSLAATTTKHQQQRAGFVLSVDGNVDIKHKRICNLRKPTENSDATNKFYVDEQITQSSKLVKTDTKSYFDQKFTQSLNPIKNELRQKIMNTFESIKKLETAIKKLEKQYHEVDMKVTKVAQNPVAAAASTSTQNLNSQSISSSSVRPSAAATNTPSTNKRMKIE